MTVTSMMKCVTLPNAKFVQEQKRFTIGEQYQVIGNFCLNGLLVKDNKGEVCAVLADCFSK